MSNQIKRRSLLAVLGGGVAVAGLGVGASASAQSKKPVELLNVSYDPTREFYEDYNRAFAKYWKTKTGQDVSIRQSHGGSGKQARSVIDGLQADVVTLALAGDIDTISDRAKLLPANWQSRLPNNSSPYTSTIVFLVKKGNPKNIRDWGDLARPGISVITPNPKTSGGARWNYLAAYGWAQRTYKDETKARDYLKKLFANVPVLDTGARGSTNTFVQRGVGDVLLAWENEAFLAVDKLGKGKFDIVVPPLSILAEPPVAIVDKVAAKKGTVTVAREYLNYLYSTEGQTLAGKHYYRPSNPQIAAQFANRFAKTQLLTIRDFGGWKKVQAQHFEYGGVFDQIYKK
jgi:sulfate/thiosulfate transport system substrate-binding protein